MKLSKVELIQFLSEHLGSDVEAVSSQLDKLVADIQKSTSKGESFVIQGFGSFTSSGGELSFEVSPAFAAEINYTYEGMQPIDIDGSMAPSTETESELPKKFTIKKPVVIVDEDVDGEEDPFGLPDEQVEDFEFVDPVAFLNDLEGKSGDPESVDSEPEFGDGFVDDIAESENEPYGAINSIDDTVDEEEKQLLVSGINLIDDKDDELTTIEASESDDPFGISDDDDTVVEDEVQTEEPVQVSGQIEEDIVETKIEELEEAFDTTEQTEELSLDNPPKEVASKTNSVLDEFFDPVSEPELKPEGVLHDSNDDVDRLLSDGEDPVQDENGPRIVSLEEDEKDYSLSFSAFFKWVAIVFAVVLIAGGTLWYLTGPEKSLFGPSTKTVSQTIVTQPIPSEPIPTVNETTSTNSDDQSLAVVDSSLIDDVTDTVAEESAAPIQTDVPKQEDSPSDVATENTQVQEDLTAELTTNEEPSQLNDQPVTGTNRNYGLDGTIQDISGGVYSIIVHSLPSRVSAQEQCNEISSLNLRCLVREATGPQGRTTYRVGVGQFESIEAAEAAVTQLPEPYRSRYFIARVN